MKVFESLKKTVVPRTGFDKSHERKMTFNMGELIPCYMDEVLPGDQFRVSSEIMLRMAPMLAPIMHRVNVTVRYFYVPTRIIWDEFEDFITGGRLGTSAPTQPRVNWGQFSGSNYEEGSLADYLGLPTYTGTLTAQQQVSLLPFRAYQQIYNDYYRDQNLTAPVDYTTVSEAMTLRKVAWEKDYFTSALPWTQRGTSPGIPLENTVPASDIIWSDPAEYETPSQPTLEDPIVAETSGGQYYGDLSLSNLDVQIKNIDEIELDNINVSVNELRRTSAIQRWLEKQARAGGRMIETILSHFNEHSGDARLQRAEYLGGGRQPVVISEVLNTSATASDPQGNMAGHGISLGQPNSFKHKFKEWGYVFGLMSVVPKGTYQQGIHKMWTRDAKEDYFWPDYADLGEEAILNRELYYDGSDDTYNQGTFGYQSKYSDYKYQCNTVHGEMKSSYDHWHIGRIFASQPNLNETFIECDPTDRIFAVTGGDPDQLICQVYNKAFVARKGMPYFSDPKLS